MQDQGENLMCLVTITYVNPDGAVVYTPAPKQTAYYAMLNSPRDIRRGLPDVHAMTEPTMPITVRLVEESVYAMRKTRLNSIYQTADMTKVIRDIAVQYGIKKIHMVPLDNTHVYDHVVIDSYQSIASIFGYLQTHYGLYTKGVNYFVTGGVLYVWPSYETDPTYDKSALFYQVDHGRFVGVPSMYRVDGTVTSAVINTEVHSYDLTIAGAENHATGFIFNRASRAGGGRTYIDQNDGAKFTEQQALTVSAVGARALASGSENTVHIKTTDNPFVKMSDITSMMASLATFKWSDCGLMLLDPCHKVVFYYDDKGVMVQKTGVVENIRYKCTKIQRVGDKYVFGCSAAVTLRLAPNQTKVI
jgi:hypothetical protein